MKLKKIIALACSLVMLASTSIVANAAVDGVTATLEFKGYETVGTNTLAVVELKATIPDTLVAYNVGEDPDTLDAIYSGKMLQSCGFDIPNVDGLSLVVSRSTCADYVSIQNNTVDNKVTVYTANTGAYSTYYAGEIATLATLKYKITGDVNGTYNLNLADASINLVEFTDPASSTPSPINYKKDTFTITNAVVEKKVPTTANVTVAANENAIVTVTKDGAAFTGGEVAVGTKLVVTAKPKAGYVIADAVINAMGGSKEITVEADTEIAIVAEEVTNAAVTVAAVYIDEETEEDTDCGLVYMFGKAPAGAAEYGINILKDGADYTFTYNKNGKSYGPKFAATSKSDEGFYGISIYGMAAGTYTINAYADDTNGAEYTFTK